jgi:predicted nuclease of predicted toxin-antitoxin system
MKLLFDQNLSPKLAALFSGSIDSSLHVQDVGLGEVDDWKS